MLRQTKHIAIYPPLYKQKRELEGIEMIIYIHGFGGSGEGDKSQMLNFLKSIMNPINRTTKINILISNVRIKIRNMRDNNERKKKGL